MSDKPQVPHAYGEFWLFRCKDRPEWGSSVGKTKVSFQDQEVKVFSDDYHPISKDLFGKYDWHRIGLPKGW